MNDYDDLILSHYKQVADEDGGLATSTMKDNYIRESETSLIQNFVEKSFDLSGKEKNDFVVADIGCGNGYTLSILSEKFPQFKFIGYEYTPELRQIAIERFKHNEAVQIRKCDIREEFADFESCDVCFTQRVVINLLSERDQMKAVKNIINYVNKGGCILFLESFQSGENLLNEARVEFGLSKVDSAYHNLLLKDSFFEWTSALTPINYEKLESNFLSSYYYIARVLHPLLLGDFPFKKNSHFVKFFSENLRTICGNYSPIQAYGFVK